MHKMSQFQLRLVEILATITRPTGARDQPIVIRYRENLNAKKLPIIVMSTHIVPGELGKLLVAHYVVSRVLNALVRTT